MILTCGNGRGKTHSIQIHKEKQMVMIRRTLRNPASDITRKAQRWNTLCLFFVFVCLVGFLTSSSTSRLYRGRAPRQRLTILRAATHETELGDHDYHDGHIILTPTQPVGSGRPQRGSNPGPPDQESRALPTELPRHPWNTHR